MTKKEELESLGWTEVEPKVFARTDGHYYEGAENQNEVTQLLSEMVSGFRYSD